MYRDERLGPEAPQKSTDLLVGGSIVALVGVIFVALGGTGIWAETQRDSNGYFSTDSHLYKTNTRAIDSDGIRVGSAVPTWFAGNVRLDVSGDKDVFVGIARKATVDAYLAKVAHAEATDPRLRSVQGRVRDLRGIDASGTPRRPGLLGGGVDGNRLARLEAPPGQAVGRGDEQRRLARRLGSGCRRRQGPGAPLGEHRLHGVRQRAPRGRSAHVPLA